MPVTLLAIPCEPHPVPTREASYSQLDKVLNASSSSGGFPEVTGRIAWGHHLVKTRRLAYTPASREVLFSTLSGSGPSLSLGANSVASASALPQPTAGSRQRREERGGSSVKMEWFSYILKSEKTGRYYIGSSSDPITRLLERHNKRLVRSTKSGVPWKIVYQEEFLTRQDAYRREMQIKRYKSGEAFKKLVNGV